MIEIEDIRAREILDSRGDPTIEVDVITKKGFGRASIPSGASTGSNEALELRDGEDRYGGKGVKKAVENVNELIRPKLIGYDVREQRKIDEEMLELDGTEKKINLGANAILAVSLGVAKAAANSLSMPLYRYLGGSNARILPVPMMNVINGGMHAGNNLAIQEHMIVPAAKRFSDAIQIASEVYHSLKKVLTDKYGKSAINIGDEGGFAPPMDNTREAFESLEKAVEEAGYSKKVFFAIDSAASEFYNDKEGYYEIDGRRLEEMELLDYYRELTEEYPIVALEDPFREEDFESFAEITDRLNIQIIGDDIFVTNVGRLKRGINMGAANALLLKINQIGTISESLDASELALRSGYGVIVSHRSGETEDTSIADIAVATGCGQIKTGAPARGERTAKYNRLIRIEEELDKTAIMGAKFG